MEKIKILLFQIAASVLMLGLQQDLPAQDCRSLTKYRQAMAKADSLIIAGDFSAAYDQYNAAKVYCRENSSWVQEAQDALFVKINGLRSLATKSKEQSDSSLSVVFAQAEASRFHNLVLNQKTNPVQSLRILEKALALNPKDEAIVASYRKILDNRRNSFPLDVDFGKKRHTDNILAIDFHPSGKYFLSGSADHTAILWCIDGRDSLLLLGHKGAITDVAFSPSGNMMITGGNDNNAIIWNLKGKEVYRLICSGKGISSISCSKNGLIGIACNDSMITCWNWKGERLYSINVGFAQVNEVEFSPDGSYLLTAGRGKNDSTEIAVWSVQDWSEKVRFTSYAHQINDLAWSPDGQQILSGGQDATAKLWDLEGTFLEEFNFNNPISSLCFTPDGNGFLVGFNSSNFNRYSSSEDRFIDYTAKQFRLDGSLEHKYFGHTGFVSELAFSHDGKYLLTASEDETIKMWQNNGKNVRSFGGHVADISSLAISPNGQFILSGSADHTVKLWHFEGNEQICLSDHDSVITAVDFHPNLPFLLSASKDNTIAIYSDKGEKINQFEGCNNGVSSAVFSPTSEVVFSGGWDNNGYLWDFKGNKLLTFSGHTQPITSVQISSDGQIFLSGSLDSTVILWDRNGEIRNVFKYEDEVFFVEFSPKSKNILIGCGNNTAIVTDTSGNKLFTINDPDQSIFSGSFSPDGNHIITTGGEKPESIESPSEKLVPKQTHIEVPVGHSDELLFEKDLYQEKRRNLNLVTLWNLKGEKVRFFDSHKSHVTTAVFSSSGQQIISGSSDNRILLWENDSLIKSGAIRLENYGTIYDVAFSPKDDLILFSSSDKKVRLFDISGNLVRILEEGKRKAQSVCFNRSGERVILAGSDNRISLLDLAGQEQFSFFSGEVRSLSVSPDDKWILGELKDTVMVWNFRGKEKVQIYPEESIEYLTFSDDSKNIIISTNKELSVWDLEGRKVNSYNLKTRGLTILSRDQQYFISDILNFGGYLYDSKGKFIKRIKQIRPLDFLPGDSAILAEGQREDLVIIDLKGNEHAKLIGHTFTGFGLNWDFSSDGNYILTAAGGYKSNTIKLWTRSGKELWSIGGHEKSNSFEKSITSMAFSPNGEKILSGGSDNNIRVCNRKGNQISSLCIPYRVIQSVKFSSDGKFIAACGYPDRPYGVSPIAESLNPEADMFKDLMEGNKGDKIYQFGKDSLGFVVVWDTLGNVVFNAFRPQDFSTFDDGYPITAVDFSVDNRYLIFGTGKTGLEFSRKAIFEVEVYSLKGKKIRSLRGHSKQVTDVAISPNNKYFLSCSTDSTVKLWSFEGDELYCLHHDQPVSTISFSHDGKFFISGDLGGTIKLWDLEGKLVRRIEGHLGSITSLAFSPDGNYVVSGGWDNSAHLYNIEGNLLKEFRSQYPCLSVGFSPDGSQLYLGFHNDRRPIPIIEDSPLPYKQLSPMEKLQFGITKD